jgi:hypothetical protein
LPNTNYTVTVSWVNPAPGYVLGCLNVASLMTTGFSVSVDDSNGNAIGVAHDEQVMWIAIPNN